MLEIPPFKILEDSEQIEKANKLLKQRFVSLRSEIIPVILPHYRTKELSVDARWFPDDHFWLAIDPEDRMIFGLSKVRPSEREKVIPTLELAIADETNRLIPGAFVRDTNGSLFLVHRGGFRSGEKEVSRRVFLRKFRGKIMQAEDGDGRSNVALIGVLGSTGFLEQVAFFLKEVYVMKKELK